MDNEGSSVGFVRRLLAGGGAPDERTVALELDTTAPPADGTTELIARARWLGATSELLSSLLTAAPSVNPFALTAGHAVRAVGPSRAVTLIGMENGDPLPTSLCDGSPTIQQVPDALLAPMADPGAATSAHLPQELLEATGLPAGPALMAPLRANERNLGLLTIVRNPGDPAFDDHEIVMAQRFASSAAVVIEHLQAQRTREALAIQHDRNRIAANLHDLVIQHLFGVGLRLQSLTSQIQPAEAAAEVDVCIDEIDDTIRHIRRSIFALQQRVDDHIGLRSRILNIVTATPFDFEPNVYFNGAIDSAIPDRMHEPLLISLGEILTNIIRHARATAVDVIVTADLDLQRAVLCVTDDGVGFSGTPLDGHGTANLLERAHELGGSCEITAADGGGTQVLWWAPLELIPPHPEQDA